MKPVCSSRNQPEINAKISAALKGVPHRPGRKPPQCLSETHKENIRTGLMARWEKLWSETSWEDMPWKRKRETFLKEKAYACEKCGWGLRHPVSGGRLVQVHHKDGDDNNWDKTNLEVLCPNCHSLTDSFMNHGAWKCKKNGV